MSGRAWGQCTGRKLEGGDTILAQKDVAAMRLPEQHCRENTQLFFSRFRHGFSFVCIDLGLFSN